MASERHELGSPVEKAVQTQQQSAGSIHWNSTVSGKGGYGSFLVGDV